MNKPEKASEAGDTATRPLPEGMLRTYPWLTFLLPFVVYMLFNTVEPTPDEAGGFGWFSVDYAYYPILYTIKIVATLGAMLVVLPGYRTFSLRITLLAPVVGAVGVVLWVVLCHADWEEAIFEPLGLGTVIGLGARPAYNPLERLADSPGLAYAFLAVRFTGLVLVVPVIEEFFIRGFVMRLAVDQDWWDVPFGEVNATAIAFGAAIMILSHPAEIFAALVWFSLVTWLMVRTRSMWDCVIAHAVTNLLLGVYVVNSGHWELM